MLIYKELLSKIQNNLAVVGVLGLGYVGLPLAIAFANENFHVIGFDKSEDRVVKITKGESDLFDIEDTILQNVIDNENFIATCDFSCIHECDVVIICVPTPLDIYKKPDMSYINAACIDIATNMKRGILISLESTTFPTTTEEYVLPLIEKESGFSHGKDYWLCYSPERVDPGNQRYRIENTPKIIGSISNEANNLALELYKKIVSNAKLVVDLRNATRGLDKGKKIFKL